MRSEIIVGVANQCATGPFRSAAAALVRSGWHLKFINTKQQGHRSQPSCILQAGVMSPWAAQSPCSARSRHLCIALLRRVSTFILLIRFPLLTKYPAFTFILTVSYSKRQFYFRIWNAVFVCKQWWGDFIFGILSDLRPEHRQVLSF